jgi:hypothetical protein
MILRFLAWLIATNVTVASLKLLLSETLLGFREKSAKIGGSKHFRLIIAASEALGLPKPTYGRIKHGCLVQVKSS